MPRKKSVVQLRNLLFLVATFLSITLLIYFTKGVTLYWQLYAIPLVIAALTFNLIGGVIVGLLGAAMTSGWLIYYNSYLTSVVGENMNHRIIEVTLGLLLYLGMGAALGYLARCRKEQKTMLEGLSIRDRLTRLYNYSYFVDKLSEEKIRSDRYGNIFSLIMFDIDSFKALNDTYGYEAGNEVLYRIAEVIAKSVRNVDIVSRYGGEEFTVLLPYAAGHDTQKVADRIREMVSKEDFDFGQSDTSEEAAIQHVTISGGVATYPIDASNETELIINADRALYNAKATGRNKVCVFSRSVIKRNQNLIKH